jgi:nitrate/TMAO reductase-like tetraheme cytochrome c subunit
MNEDNPPTPGTPDPSPSPAPQPKLGWWWKVFGMRPRKGRFLRIKPTLWGWVVVLLVMGGVGFGSFIEYSMKPDFCRSCHLMEPYYQAWHNSSHKNVNCVECHFEPGLENTIKGKWQASSQAAKFITNTYGSKPHAEIQDVSCMRSGCHEKRLLEGKVKWDVTTPDGHKVSIRFDHAPHLQETRRGKQLRCVSCHSQIVQGQHITVTLDTCFLCHFKGKQHGRHDETIGGCTACHDAPKKEIRVANGVFNHGEYLARGVDCESCHSDSIKGNGEVPRQVCWNCHNQTAQVSRYGESAFVHQTHVSNHKVECSSCHVQIEHGLRAGAPREDKLPQGNKLLAANHVLADSGSCGQCHEQMHGGPAEIYRGVGGRGVPDMPSPMYRAQVDCIACHRNENQTEDAAKVVGQTFVAAQASCDRCHGNHYSDILGIWKKTIDDHLRRADVAYEDARKALAKVTLASKDTEKELKGKRLLDDAAANIRLVRLGHGVHNVTYATAVLNAAIDQAEQVVELAGDK